MRLRSLLLSVLMLVAVLFTVNAKANNYSSEYAKVIREAKKPYTVHLKNEKKLYDFCMGFASEVNLEGYLSEKINYTTYRKVPVSEFKDEFQLGFLESLFMRIFQEDSLKVLIKLQAQAYENTDKLVKYYHKNKSYMYIPASKPIGDTLKVLVDKNSFSYTKDGKKYVFKNIGESAQSYLTIATGNKNINLNYFTFIRAEYDSYNNNCTIVAE